MTCPRCGYAHADFDTFCLRCRLMDAQGIRPAVNPADQTIVMSDLPGPALPPSIRIRRRSHLWLPVLLTLLVGAAVWHLTVAARQTNRLSVGTHSPS